VAPCHCFAAQSSASLVLKQTQENGLLDYKDKVVEETNYCEFDEIFELFIFDSVFNYFDTTRRLLAKLYYNFNNREKRPQKYYCAVIFSMSRKFKS
jgi:hypothetical protein